MPLLLPPEFDIVIVPELVRVPSLRMPMLSPVFDTTSVVPNGTTSSSPAEIVLPSVMIVQVSGELVHVPP